MADGRLVLVSPRATGYMDVRPREQPLLALLDGVHDLDALVAAGLEQELPARPVQVLDLLQRLASRDMLEMESLSGPASRVIRVPAQRSLRQRLAALLDVRLLVAPLRHVVSPGVIIPAKLWRLFALGGLLAAVFGLGYAIAVERADHLLNPFFRLRSPLAELPLIYLGLCVTLSFRGLVRGWALRSQGVDVPRVGLRLAWGLLFIEVDDREKRAATRDDRAVAAAVGLGALGWVAAVALLGWVTGLHPLFRYVAPVALLAFLADLAPYLGTDGHEIIAIHSRVRQLRHRALSYLLRRAVTNLASGAALGDNERRYLILAVASMLHMALAVRVLAVHVIPGVLDTTSRLLSHAGEGSTAGLVASALVATLLFAGLLMLLAGLVAVVAAFVLQLTRARAPRLPPAEADSSATLHDAFVAAAGHVPFLARIPAGVLTDIAAGMRAQTAKAGQPVVRQGEAGDRFYFIAQGSCAIEVEDDSGRRHRLRVLQAGDFFGEVALVFAMKRTAHVVAIEDTELLTLDRDSFHRIIEASDANAGDVVAELRGAALIRAVPSLAYLSADETRSVLEAMEVESYAPGATIVEQGAVGDALFIVRDGSVTVERTAPGGSRREVAVLGVGECFGELAFFVEGGRTASVVAAEAVVVLRIPSTVFHRVLLSNFSTAVVLDELGMARLAALREGES